MTRKEQIIQAAMQEEKKVGFAQIVKDAKGVNSAYGIGLFIVALIYGIGMWVTFVDKHIKD